MSNGKEECRVITIPDDVNISVILTKRELFAAMAMQGFCAGKMGEVANKKRIAEISVEQADELLEKLKDHDDNGGGI